MDHAKLKRLLKKAERYAAVGKTQANHQRARVAQMALDGTDAESAPKAFRQLPPRELQH